MVRFAVAASFLVMCIAAAAETVTMPMDTYLDKCRGAWAGQMIGVCYGDIYEFRSNGKPITGPLEPWKPERIHNAIYQDDCYVEMTFLETIEKHGLDITYEQAGAAFGASEYKLWHANRAGRDNVRNGIMPPMSGQPSHNRHADDIDFQIESDLFGILCPGLPQESNRLCDTFGRIMNYGDGVYGGMFVAGMYAAAYFESGDVRAVIEHGLACIPTDSEYAKCIRDVLAWHDAAPEDWRSVWQLIEDKWQDDVDCTPGNPLNIDAKLNGAYIVMGLLYGEGDILKTAEYATRCGQDTDCNASNAVGVLACMKGFRALDSELTSGIAAIASTPFDYTRYSFEELIPACQRVTGQLVLRAGGQMSDKEFTIPVQAPEPPKELEQWSDQEEILLVAISPDEIKRWNPDWRLRACGADMDPGLRAEMYGRKQILALHPVNRDTPAVMEAELAIPAIAQPALNIIVTSDERGDFILKVFADNAPVHESLVSGHGEWETIPVDLSAVAGKQAIIRIEVHANDWHWEAAYFDKITVMDSGTK